MCVCSCGVASEEGKEESCKCPYAYNVVGVLCICPYECNSQTACSVRGERYCEKKSKIGFLSL